MDPNAINFFNAYLLLQERRLLHDKLKQTEKDLLEANSRVQIQAAQKKDDEMEDFQSELQCVICSELFITVSAC